MDMNKLPYTVFNDLPQLTSLISSSLIATKAIVIFSKAKWQMDLLKMVPVQIMLNFIIIFVPYNKYKNISMIYNLITYLKKKKKKHKFYMNFKILKH